MDGGFSVIQSYTETWGQADTYSRDGTDVTVCVWVNFAHTAYTIQVGGLPA